MSKILLPIGLEFGSLMDLALKSQIDRNNQVMAVYDDKIFIIDTIGNKQKEISREQYNFINSLIKTIDCYGKMQEKTV